MAAGSRPITSVSSLGMVARSPIFSSWQEAWFASVPVWPLHRVVHPLFSQSALAAFSNALLGRFDEALPFTRRAVDLDPLKAGSWEYLGELKFVMGQLDEAAADIKKAQELSSDALQPCILERRFM